MSSNKGKGQKITIPKNKIQDEAKNKSHLENIQDTELEIDREHRVFP